MNKIILILVCLFAFLVRIQSINQMGRAMDEDYIVEKGFKFVSMFQVSDFANPYWWSIPDHPPLGNYIFGISAKLDAIGFDPNKEAMDKGYKGVAIFPFELTYSRLVAILFSVLTIYITTFLSLRYLGKAASIATGVILSTIPFYLGLSQNVNLDVIFSFFFTASIAFFILYLENPTLRKAMLVGFFVGCTILTKQTGIILFPLLISLYILQTIFSSYSKKNAVISMLQVTSFAVLTTILLWPMAIIHFSEYLQFSRNMWLHTGGYPEWFMGSLRITPIFYYFMYGLISIPIGIIFLCLYGAKWIIHTKKMFLMQILLWIIVPIVIQSFYKGRQHQLRYVAEIYAPVAILAGYGFSMLIKKLNKKPKIIFFAFSLLLIYCLSILIKISPYYFDYFNELTGGTNTVFHKKLFQMGFGGQGLGEATEYLIKNAKKGSTVSICADPFKNVNYSAPFKFRECDVHGDSDYIIVNYYIVIRDGFDETKIDNRYKIAYTVYADEAELVHVYKKIK